MEECVCCCEQRYALFFLPCLHKLCMQCLTDIQTNPNEWCCPESTCKEVFKNEDLVFINYLDNSKKRKITEDELKASKETTETIEDMCHDLNVQKRILNECEAYYIQQTQKVQKLCQKAVDDKIAELNRKKEIVFTELQQYLQVKLKGIDHTQEEIDNLISALLVTKKSTEFIAEAEFVDEKLATNVSNRVYSTTQQFESFYDRQKPSPVAFQLVAKSHYGLVEDFNLTLDEIQLHLPMFKWICSFSFNKKQCFGDMIEPVWKWFNESEIVVHDNHDSFMSDIFVCHPQLGHQHMRKIGTQTCEKAKIKQFCVTKELNPFYLTDTGVLQSCCNKSISKSKILEVPKTELSSGNYRLEDDKGRIVIANTATFKNFINFMDDGLLFFSVSDYGVRKIPKDDPRRKMFKLFVQPDNGFPVLMYGQDVYESYSNIYTRKKNLSEIMNKLAVFNLGLAGHLVIFADGEYISCVYNKNGQQKDYSLRPEILKNQRIIDVEFLTNKTIQIETEENVYIF